jgi:outer membrane murein-binding lipoprotein Lpp/predicted phosphodiesterase
MNISSKQFSRMLLIAVILSVLCLAGGIGLSGAAANAATATKTVSTKIVHLTDIHVMPPSYCNTYSKAYKSAAAGNTKLLEQSGAIFETSLQELYDLGDDAPMYIIITGDLTSNGEYDANVYVADILKQFTKKMRGRTDTTVDFSGFQIFVIPGNHDMYNENAVSYMPTAEELAACANADERRDLLENYEPRSVKTTTVQDIFEIYSDFGYCNCSGRAEGDHDDGCGMAEGCKLNFFYESEYWYDDTTCRTTNGDETVYSGFTVKTPSEDELAAFKESDKDFEILAEDGRIGACSYVAELNGLTVVGIDGAARSYSGEYENVAQRSASGWNETTGGMCTRNMIRWVLDETADDVEKGNLIITACHFNMIPHFDAEDEVISLFCLDNWEQTTAALANAGLHYGLTGHQHTNDIVDYVTQSGNVFYDIETSSTVSYGSSYRILTFIQKQNADGTYYEDLKSTVCSLRNNLGNDYFSYPVYKLAEDVTAEDTVLTDVLAAPELLEPDAVVDEPDLFGQGYILLTAAATKNKNGDKISVADFLTLGLANMADDMVDEMLNDSLYDTLESALDGLSDYKYTKNMLSALLSGLRNFDCLKIDIASDGKSFSLSDAPAADYDLVDTAKSLADYFLDYDFSYGTVQGGETLGDLLFDVYGGHLTGANNAVMSKNIAALVQRLKDGTFVRFLIDTLYDSVIPELEFILDAPIRISAATPELPEGKGFDISSVIEGSAEIGIDGTIKMIFTNYLIKSVDADGYSSVRLILKDISSVIQDLFVTETDRINDGTLRFLSNFVRGYVKNVSNIGDYIDMAIKYLAEYEDGTLYGVLKEELLDKYVTDAFCTNLGEYAAYLVLSFDTDTIPDGSYWGSGNKYESYTVVNITDFNVTARDENGEAYSEYYGHAYYRGADGADTVKVEPTTENGLLPSMVSVAFNGDVETTKKVQWFTSIETDVTDKNAKGEYEYSVPESYIKYSVSKDMSDAVTVKAVSENVDRELPTIDLGIIYVNLNHRYKIYNKHTAALEGLKAGTEYFYTVGSDKYGWSDVYSFETAKADGAFSFIAITDIQGSVEKNYTDSMVNLAVAAAADTDAAFTVSCGDNVDNGKNIMQYTWWLDDQSAVWANTTLVTLAGNHEDSGNALSSIVAVPEDATVLDTGFYYSYDYENVHFIVLDTNDLDSDKKLSATQTAWLNDDLEKNNENKNTEWTVVMLHKGPYTVGSHAFDADVIALRAQLTPIFADNGVDIVLQGHDHTYSVSQYIGADGNPVKVSYDGNGAVKNPDGVLYINLGTMGDKYYNYIYSDAVSLISRDGVGDARLQKYYKDGKLELTETPVFADIAVDGNKLVIKTYTVIDGEAVPIDTVSLTKNSGINWDAITPGEYAAAASVGGGIIVIVILIVIAADIRKKTVAWKLK